METVRGQVAARGRASGCDKQTVVARGVNLSLLRCSPCNRRVIVWYEFTSSQSLSNVKVNNSGLIASIKMQIKCKYLRRTSLSAISLVTTNRSSKKGGRSLDELNECSLAGGSGKQEK